MSAAPLSASRCQLLVELAALAVLAAVSARLFAPGDAWSLAGGLAVAYAVPRAAYTTRSWCTTAGRWVLTTMGLAMCALAVLTVWECTVAAGLTTETPLLIADDGNYFRWALHHYDGRCAEPRVAFPGFPMLMLWSWRVLGVSVVWPIALNVLLTLLAVVMTAATTRRLLAGVTRQSDGWHATAALCMTAVLAYFLSQGLRVQKEAMVYLSITCIGYALAGMNNRHGGAERQPWRDAVLWAGGCLMLALARTTYLYFALIGLAVVGLPRFRHHWRTLLAALALAAPAIALGNHLASYSVEGHLDIVRGGYYMQKAFLSGTTQQPYLDLIGDYFMQPVWRRLAILPLACCVQFVIPFPWVYTSPTVLTVLPRLAWGWYAVGGMVLFYYLMQFTRGGRRLGIGAWAWWPAAIYVIIAYVVAGTVHRYVLPVELLGVPLAVTVLARLREGEWRRAFRRWALAYVLALATTLVVCHHIQTTYLQQLDDYYRRVVKLHE
ncbi:MAG: hypothetical protein IJT30_10340 [Muribaculaceae bacterium]|nr:hypothetical protein [Muribaculaceae bacterium]